MTINNIKVSNILAYKDETEFELEQNPVYIIGPNGSGKSSIIDIISVALYRKPARTSSLSSILSDPEKTGYVSLTFEFMGDSYRVERYIGKKGSGKHDKLYKNDELIIQGTQNVTKTLEELVGPQSTWISLVPQRQLTNVLQSSTFRDLYYQTFQIDKVGIFIKAANKLANKRRYEIEAKQEEIHNLEQEISSIMVSDSEVEQLEKQSKDLMKHIEELTQRDFASELVDLHNKKKDLEVKLHEAKRFREIQEKTKKYIYLLDMEIDEYKLEMVNLYKHKEDEIRTWFLIKHDKYYKILENLEQHLSVFNHYQRVKEKIPEVLKLQDLYEKYSQYSLTSLLKPQSKFPLSDKEVKQKVIELVGYLNNVYNLGLDIETIDNIDDGHFDIIKQHIKYLRTKTDAPSLGREERNLLSKFKSWKEVKDYVDQIWKEFNELKKELSYFATRAPKVKLVMLNRITLRDYSSLGSLEEYYHYKKILSDIIEISRYVESFNKWKTIMGMKIDDSMIEDLEKQLLDIQQKIDKIEKEKQQQHEKLQKLNRLYQELQTKLHNIKAQLQYKQNLEVRKAKLEKQLEKLIQSKEKYDKLINIYETLKDVINQRFKQTLPILVKSTVEKFGFDFTIEIDDDFSIKVYKDGNILTPQMLSGAQQSVLALAIRYNIAKLLNSSLPFVLDEVTEGFDFNRIDLLKGFINQLAQTHQVIAISHDDRIVSDSIGQIIQLGG